MKNRILLTLILSLFAFWVSAQTPENVVRNYVRVLNDWLASPYDYDKKEKVIRILSDPNGNCTMSDEIVEKFNSDAGKYRSSRDTYLSILSEKNRSNPIHVEIIDFKNFEYQSDKTVVTVGIKYSGGISMTTVSELWIFDDKIGYIDKGRNTNHEIVEREKIVEVESSDHNTGKAYLILNISEPNAKVEIDGKKYSVSGKQFKASFKYGDYNVYISKDQFKTEMLHVRLRDEPVIQDVHLKIAEVQIRIEKDFDAVLYVDGNYYGKNQNTVTVRADRRHKFKIEKSGHTKSKTVKVYKKPFTIVMPQISTEQIPQSNWFVGCNYSPKLSLAGFSIGNCNKFGFILNGGFSILAFKNWYNRNLEKGDLLDTFKIKYVMLDNGLLDNTKQKGQYRSYIRIGPMVKTFDFLYLYAAVGCGTYADIKEYDGYLFAPSIHKTWEGEAGIMLKYKRFGLTASYVQNIGKERKFYDYSVGLYYWMRVLKKQQNPENRFIIGYRYSPSAQFGMSLGVAFGYYEKWGLIINWGSSTYLMKKGLMLGYYSFDGKIAEGICRSYYHFGPFFRLNNIFAYYFTIGYGSYKPNSYECFWEGEYNGGWDGETGIMLKLGHLSFSFGYQHNIGKQNNFSDLNIGVQLWLGK